MKPSLSWVTTTEPINTKTHSGEKVFQPGEVFQVNPVKAKPLLEKKILKVSKPIEAIDVYWLKEILPRLSRLHMARRLPDLSTCLLWLEMESHWQTPAPMWERERGSRGLWGESWRV